MFLKKEGNAHNSNSGHSGVEGMLAFAKCFFLALLHYLGPPVEF